MMGQQQQTVMEKLVGLRRIVLALTVAALMALVMALGADPSQAKINESSSGNLQASTHINDGASGPAGGGGAEVNHGVQGGDLGHDVITPSGNRNGMAHMNVQN